MGAQRPPCKDRPRHRTVALHSAKKGRWFPMGPKALTSARGCRDGTAEQRSAEPPGLLDVDDEFFRHCAPGCLELRLLPSDATAALDYDIAAEVLNGRRDRSRST